MQHNVERFGARNLTQQKRILYANGQVIVQNVSEAYQFLNDSGKQDITRGVELLKSALECFDRGLENAG